MEVLESLDFVCMAFTISGSFLVKIPSRFSIATSEDSTLLKSDESVENLSEFTFD